MIRTATFEDPPGFAELSKADQIEYLQILWDRISSNPAEVPVPESHIALAEERLAAYRRHPERAVPAFEALDALAARQASKAE